MILHVEDDLLLRAVVTMTFDRLGFRGTIIPAPTLAQAERVLAERAKQGARLDLILSDMHLPDGTGLDVVKLVRGSPVWRTTPMLILSGDLDRKFVDRAYALGANAYIDKSPKGRSTSEVITTLYRHWLKDVVLAHGSIGQPALETLARAMTIRLRFADVYVRIAEQLGDNAAEAAFWLSRALAESNLANLLAFMKLQLDGRELGEPLTSEIVAVQHANEAAIAALESDVAAARLSRDQLYQRILDLLATTDVNVVSRSLGALFPVSPVAVAALRDLLVGAIGDTTAWIDLHTSSSELHLLGAQLRSAAATLAENQASG